MQQRKRLKKASDGKSGAPEEALSDDDDLFSENSPEKQTRTATNPSSLVTFEHVQGKKKLMKPTSARNHDDDDDNFLNSEDLEAKNLSQTSKAKPTAHKAVDIIAAEGTGNDTDDEAENETFLTSLQHPQLESIIEADDSRALGCALINRDFTFVEFPDEIRQKKGSKHQILDMYCLCLAAASAGAEKCLEFLLLAIDEVGGREGTHLKSKSISSTAIQSKIAALVQQSEEKEGKDKQSSDTTASPIASSSSSSLSSSAISSGHHRRLYIHIGNACDILLSMNNRNFLPPDALGGTGAGTSSSGKQLPCAYHSAIQMHAPPLLLVAMRKGHIEVIRLLCESYPLHSLTLLSDPVDVSATAVLDTEGAPVVSSLFTFVGEHTFPGVLVALMTIDKAIMTLRTSLSLTSSGASSLVHINNKGVDVNSASKGVLLQIMSEEYQELQSVKVIELLKKKNNDGSNLLLWAAEEGLADFVDALLHMVPELIAQVDKAGITPLHSACMMGHVEVLHVLLRHDIDIFVADRRGWTGLLYALLRENVPCVLELLKANTDGALQHIQVLGKFLSNQKKDDRRHKILGALASIPEFFEMINKIVRQNLETLNGDHMGFILAHPSLLNLENKLIVGRRLCMAIHECSTTPYDRYPLLQEDFQMASQVRLQREDPWKSLTLYFSGKTDENGDPIGHEDDFRSPSTPSKLKLLLVLRRRMQLQYKGVIEVGSGPGVEREVIEGVTKGMVDPSNEYSIFRSVGDEQLTYVPAPLKCYHRSASGSTGGAAVDVGSSSSSSAALQPPRSPPPSIRSSLSLPRAAQSKTVSARVARVARVARAASKAKVVIEDDDGDDLFDSYEEEDDDDDDDDEDYEESYEREADHDGNLSDDYEVEEEVEGGTRSRRRKRARGDNRSFLSPLKRPCNGASADHRDIVDISSPYTVSSTSLSRLAAFHTFGQLVGHFILRKFAAAPSTDSSGRDAGQSSSQSTRGGERGRGPRLFDNGDGRAGASSAGASSRTVALTAEEMARQHSEVHGYSLLNINLPQCFWKLVLLKQPTLEDVSGLDATLYQSLLWVQENTGVENLSLTFSAAENAIDDNQDNPTDFAGVSDARTDAHTVVVPLIEGGEDRDVTDKNKSEYVRLMIQHCTAGRFGKQADAVRKGILDVIPAGCLDMFTDRQLGLLLCGTPAIDVNDWKMHASCSGGYSRKSNVVGWFWKLVEDIQDTERGLLLRFCTGCSRLPTGGFIDLKPSFTITQIAYNPSRALPTAATCFNLLRLPAYPDEATLRKSVMTAILHGSEGFSFS